MNAEEGATLSGLMAAKINYLKLATVLASQPREADAPLPPIASIVEQFDSVIAGLTLLVSEFRELKGWDHDLFCEQTLAIQFKFVRDHYPPELAERIIAQGMRERREKLLREARTAR